MLKLSLTLISLLLFFPNTVYGADEKEAEDTEAETVLKGDVLCEADVFYTWKHSDKSSDSMAEGDSVEMMKSAPEPSKIEKVFFTRFGEKGSSEEQARNRLLSLLPRVEREARTYCERKHQDQALCMARQLRASDYQRVDFTVRQALLPAITESCQQIGGTCLETKVGTLACYALSPSDSKASEEDEKDSNKGKK